MFNILLRAFLSLFIFLSVSSAYAQNKVVVIPLGGDDISQCQAITACVGGQQTLSCPSGEEQISCSIPKRVFKTSTIHNGSLGRLEGADSICQGLANNAELNGVFKAWLSDSSGSSPDNRFIKNEGPYVRTDGVLVAANWLDLTDGELLNRILANEDGLTTFGSNFAWTDTFPNGTDEPNLFSCIDWTNGGGVSGWVGRVSDTSVPGWWSLSDQVDCGQLGHLYCFEQ